MIDPACGSGNFLAETYISLRKLENDVIQMKLDSRTASTKSEREKITKGQVAWGVDVINPIQVSIQQLYGIEINDFAATVAKTALWIAESQMMKRTEDIVHMSLDFLPLKSYVNIVEGNALRIDWNDVVPASELSYIMGNPPFVGFKFTNDIQKSEMKHVFSNDIKPALLDYVCCWYKKAAEYIQNTTIEVGFVSTNSVTQGQMAGDLWTLLLGKYHIHINFAHRTFVWQSESNDTASVHVVIIGFAVNNRATKKYI